MEIFIAVAMVCIFVAGRKSVKNQLRGVDNATEYRIDVNYDPKTRTLTVTSVSKPED
jgi:hypothetical protein